MRFKDYYIEIGAFALCFLNLFFPVIPQLLLYVVVIGCAWNRLPREAIGFCCLLFLKDVNHAMFFLNYHISGIAPLTVLIGLFLMRDFFMSQWKHMLSYGKHLWMLMGLFFVSMLVMGTYAYNVSKLTALITAGFFAYIAYCYILYNRDKLDYYKLALYCAIFAIFLLQLNVVANHYGTPSSITDFAFYRLQVGADMYTDLAESGILYATHYQFFGTMCTYGFALCLSLCKLNVKQVILLLTFNIFAIGYTGARQYLLIMVVLFSIYILFMKAPVIIKSLIILCGFVLVSYIVYNTIMSDYIEKISDSGLFAGSGREDTIERGMALFKQHPIFGVGFGGYNMYGDYKVYPHNMFVELLAEVGITGLIIIVLIELSNIKGMRVLLDSKHNTYLMYVVMALFLRSMISLSMTGNIVLFSVLSACYYYTRKRVC